MRENALSKHQKVLDFGCGYGRTAIPLIKYLNKSNYIGVELSKKRLSLASKWVARENLEHKLPRFLHSSDNKLAYLKSDSIDFIWTLSVFNHIPDTEVDELLVGMNRVLKKGGALFFYFVEENQEIQHKKSGSEVWAKFPRSLNDACNLLEKNNYNVTDAKNWKKILRYPDNQKSHMLIATKKK